MNLLQKNPVVNETFCYWHYIRQVIRDINISVAVFRFNASVPDPFLPVNPDSRNITSPGSGKTRTARLWVYVRNDRNAGSEMPPAVWFAYSPDRKGIHPQNHLAGYSGVL